MSHIVQLEYREVYSIRRCKWALWDICLSERNVFCVYSGEALQAYCYAGASAAGAEARRLASTRLAASLRPLLLFAGDVYCYTAGGGSVPAYVTDITFTTPLSPTSPLYI